jgi:uncharacterized protein YaeQ
MANTATLYRFHIELADVQRSVYESLDLRVAQHPSEAMPYMLTRVLAYALNTQEGLEFSSTGLHDPDAAAISVADTHGGYQLVIEIGSPSAKRMHKVMKTAKKAKVYTYKNPENMLSELRSEKIHRADEIELYSLSPEFLIQVSEVLKRDNRWALLIDDGVMTIQSGELGISGEITQYYIQKTVI